jgi:hypothetical protein
MAMIGVIVGEFITAQAGLGYIIMFASSAGETATAWRPCCCAVSGSPCSASRARRVGGTPLVWRRNADWRDCVMMPAPERTPMAIER